MSAESAHLSTFGAETETEAEIRSTSKANHQFLKHIITEPVMPLKGSNALDWML